MILAEAFTERKNPDTDSATKENNDGEMKRRVKAKRKELAQKKL